jgi:hypothetical protein
MRAGKVIVIATPAANAAAFIGAVSDMTVLSMRQQSAGAASGLPPSTLTLDFGRISVDDDLALYLFGVPGEGRLALPGEALAGGVVGAVLLFDASDEIAVGHARAAARFFGSRSDAPYVLAASGMTDSGETALKVLRAAVEIGNDVPLRAVDVHDRESVKAVVLALLHHAAAGLSE